MILKSLIIFVFLFTSQLFSKVFKREVPLSLKTSLIIPCYSAHIRFMPNLIKKYVYDQTVLPDEIVVSISNMPEVRSRYSKFLNELENTNWPIPVILIKNEKPVSEGDNRNRACRKAIGDVLICQDADDLPHSQRVELIKYFFENYTIDHLVHKYFISYEINLLNYNIDRNLINWFAPADYEINNGANGVASISRRVFDTIQWNTDFSRGNDVKFNMQAYSHFENRIVINEPIYLYRQYYSGDE